MLAAKFKDHERRNIARRHFESVELWLRKIIDHIFSYNYGPDYFSHQSSDGTYLIKNEIRKRVYELRKKELTRFTRDIDATTFEQAIQIVTNPNYFKEHFEPVLKIAYPHGAAEAKTFLMELVRIRNKIDHVGCCSARDFEKAVCYSNDLIDSVKAYFTSIRMDRLYNVPKITFFVDSVGNESHMENVPHDFGTRIIDWRTQGKGELRPGDSLRIEIEVDQSFNREDYTISWYFGRRGVVGDDVDSIFIDIQASDVGTQVECRATVTSKLDWHEFGSCGDSLCVIYRVLPPL
jgi:hypothetical protein